MNSQIKDELKKLVFQSCHQQIRERVANIEVAIEQAEHAGADDTKSSAGDKYETTREMMQQEIERNQSQLLEAKKALFQLEQLEDINSNDQVVLGSLIDTNRGLFYLSISLGQLLVDGHKVMVLSPASPLGQIFNGKNKNSSFSFNGISYTINDTL